MTTRSPPRYHRRSTRAARPGAGEFNMKWVTYLSPSGGAERVGVLVDNEILGAAPGVSLIDLLRQGGADLTEAAARLRSNPAERVPAGSVELKAPVPVPPAIRDFFGFEDHAVNSLK